MKHRDMPEPANFVRDRVELSADLISLSISAKGAELCSLRDHDHVEYLWGAGSSWPKHAPLLFPIVGRLANDRFDYRGRSYQMPKHGFARDKAFELVEASKTSARFSLRSDDSTLLIFPFEFSLDVDYRILGNSVDIRFAVTNSGSDAMPFSLGAHPAFRWPLGDALKTESKIVFAHPEPGPIRRLTHGFIGYPVASPVRERMLMLDDELFHDDAIVFDVLTSRELTYSCKSGRSLEIAWRGFKHLGLWSKPGSDFICIEPWHGYDSPERFVGELDEKPGIAIARPKETVEFGLTIRIMPPCPPAPEGADRHYRERETAR